MHQQKLVKIFSAVLAGENENNALLLHKQPIAIEQKTIDQFGNPQTISTKGRHDISAIPA